MHHPTDRIPDTTVFVIPVVGHWLEREISQWVHSMKGGGGRLQSDLSVVFDLSLCLHFMVSTS